MCRVGWTASCFFILAGLLVSAQRTQSFKFVLLGDRTGEAQPGVYEQIWSEIGREKPSFVLSGGDTIQGGNDNTARQEWKAVFSMLAPYRSIPFYLVPGNHDVWSPLSESLFRQFARRPVHYSFDYGQLHVTVLDNSRTEELAANELKFLTSDLDAHKQQPLKMIISHRPSWLIPILFSNPRSAVHQIAKKYGVQYVVGAHIHQMLRFDLEGITYFCLPSAGGHLRASKAFSDGWFFGHILVHISNDKLTFRIQEVGPSRGAGRVTALEDWGSAGLVKKAS
jgi:Icc protein